eukprot:1980240-Rhodomonas_salina.2
MPHSFKYMRPQQQKNKKREHEKWEQRKKREALCAGRGDGTEASRGKREQQQQNLDQRAAVQAHQEALAL